MSDIAPQGDYAGAPVPESLTVPGWRVALIIASFTFSLPSFLNGAQTGLAIGLYPAVLAAFIGGAILCIGACFTSVISVRTRLTTYVLIQRSFGIRGASLVNVVLAAIHFCWFGVNVSFFGDAMVAAREDGYGIPGNFGLYVIIGTILITASTIYGFKMLDRLAMIAVPLVGVILIAVCVMTVNMNAPVDLGPSDAPPVSMTFGIAISAFVGSNMLAIAAMPDLSRFIRTERGAIGAMALSYPFCLPIVMSISALIGLATFNTDIMQLVTILGFGAPALIVLLMSVWTINALNLYSAGLSLQATFPKVPQWVFVVGGGAIGCTLALLGIIDHFIQFLVTLAIVIPPIAAIYVVDGLITFKDEEKNINPPAFRWSAIVIWLLSLLIILPTSWGGIEFTTVPALDATLLAAVLYLGFIKLRRTGHSQP